MTVQQTFLALLEPAQRRAYLTDLLRENECRVTFTKVDGSVRVMPCTLDPAVLPPAPIHESNTGNPVDFPKVKKENPEVISVYCTDKNEWRSFRVMNVTDVEVL